MINYSTKKLGDCLVQFDRGISWSRKDEGGTIAVLRIPNIQEGHINLDDLKYISAKNGNGELYKNDIVMVASNGNPDLVGRSALVTEKEEEMRFASFLIRLRLDNTKLLSQYAHLFLLTPTFKRELRRKIATTSGIYNLKKEHIENLQIPLPPLQIQKQIVERMDKIVEAQKLNDDLIKKSDELFQSLLQKELGHAGKNWGIRDLGTVCDVRDGTHESPKFFPEGIPLVTSKNLTGGSIDFSDIQLISEKDYLDIEKRSRVTDGDILFGMIGTIGNPVIVHKDRDFSIKNVGLIKFTETSPLNTFIFYTLMSVFIERQIKKFSRGGTQKFVSLGNLRALKIPIPSPKTQKQIVAKLSAVQEYKKQLLTQKSKLKELFDSVLHKSMEGEKKNDKYT